MKISLVPGRIFSDTDGANSAPAAVISRGMPRVSGRREAQLDTASNSAPKDSAEPWLTIVGVVGDVRQNWWNSLTRPVIFTSRSDSRRNAP
ncbi:MAG: hypothetical protein AUG46_06700 [Acidobacteria bacterium 13_1_20CM_3_58_11]|nr:MAG: hypothetical protein AUG46_06700 [Acidobacteria bacterium 13_1_20CM_3_58_11]